VQACRSLWDAAQIADGLARQDTERRFLLRRVETLAAD
jgi:hypothetical protein